MSDTLRINLESFEKRTITEDHRTITFRALEGIPYCEKPKDAIQKVNIYIPEAYFNGESIGVYTAKNAPYFLPNTVGGYMPGPADTPGFDNHTNQLNTLFRALEHGYIAVSAGVRGRTSGKAATEFFEGSKEGLLGENTGRMVGRAPAFIVDMKAAIRFLRHNRDVLPGDTDKIITNGTSAGGALSALTGASGNAEEFAPYLKEIGSADERDDIFAASCYCPIHNLENADAAYEWLFAGLNDFHRTKHKRTENGIIRVPFDGEMTPEQIALSEPLKKLFPSYVNSLALSDENGLPLTLDADGEGSFKDHVKKQVIASAERELQTHDTEENRSFFMVKGSEISEQTYLTREDGHITGIDFDAYVHKITRMKATPAFDAVDLTSPENEEFGDEQVDGRHFSAFSMEHNTAEGAEMADAEIISMMNPTEFLRNGHGDHAPFWRVRHGAFDRDTSLAIPVILALLLQKRGIPVDFALPWGLPHSGDYDIPELFAWIDSCIASS